MFLKLPFWPYTRKTCLPICNRKAPIFHLFFNPKNLFMVESWECRHIKVIMGENWKLFVWHERPLIATHIYQWVKNLRKLSPIQLAAATVLLHTHNTHAFNLQFKGAREFKFLFFGEFPCGKTLNCLAEYPFPVILLLCDKTHLNAQTAFRFSSAW